MNPLRNIREFDPVFLALAVTVCVGILAIVWWSRRRVARGEWGPGLTKDIGSGYTPKDLRRTAAATPRRDDDRWLLGLAAPLVEQARMLHDRWSLVPASADAEWMRQLRLTAEAWRITRRPDWVRTLADVEASLREGTLAADDPRRVVRTASFAMLLRLGVALRYTDARAARRRLAAVAAPLRAVYGDWLSYGDAYLEGRPGGRAAASIDQRAELRLLYADGGPWS